VPRPAKLTILALAFLALVGTAVAAPLRGNPANDPRLLHRHLEPPRYDYADRCLHREQPGTRALARWLDRHFRGASWGIVRCEKLSARSWSLHSEGRALDWALNAAIPAQRRSARNLIRMLLARDREGEPTALARRMGVQGLIFDCRNWWAGSESMDRYDYCFTPAGRRRRHLDPTQAHRNHIHIELNWAGAKRRTSFWRSPLSTR
jgi:hypothetical protein